MKKVIKLNENDINNIVRRIITESFVELPETEDVETYNILNDNFDGNWRDVMFAKLYNENDECIGTLRDLHFKYDTEKCRLI